MRVRALKTFSNKEYGLVRTGMVVTAEKNLAAKWVRTGLAEVFDGPVVADAPQPNFNAAHDAPPQTKDALQTKDAPQGNDEEEQEDQEEPPEQSGISSSSVAPRRAGGKGRLSASQPRVRPSRKGR
jgi:hypothetical protein